MKRRVRQLSLILLPILMAVSLFVPVANLVLASPATTIPLEGVTWPQSTVTVKILAGNGVTPQAVTQARQAIFNWDAKINGEGGFQLELEPADTKANVKTDVTIVLKGGGGLIAGLTTLRERNGFLESVHITISGKAFGQTNSGEVILSITEHEFGHALGLGHADNPADLMYPVLQDPPVTAISNCDLEAWEAVMDWLLTDSSVPYPPLVSSVTCP